MHFSPPKINIFLKEKMHKLDEIEHYLMVLNIQYVFILNPFQITKNSKKPLTKKNSDTQIYYKA